MSKYSFDVFSCDICAAEVSKYPHDTMDILPKGGAFVDGISNYQTVYHQWNNMVICSHCCLVIQTAIDNKLVIMPEAIKDEMYRGAGYKKEKDNIWVKVD